MKVNGDVFRRLADWLRMVASQTRFWALPAILAVAVFFYTSLRFDQVQYWDGAIGNLAASLLGIIVGVPVALHLERRRVSTENAEVQRKENRLKIEILTLLFEELKDNLQRLQQRAALSDSFIPEPLKLSIWDALRNNGSLRYISEPSLMNIISNSYRFLMIINNREEYFIQSMYGVNGTIRFPDGESATQKIKKITEIFYLPALGPVYEVA